MKKFKELNRKVVLGVLTMGLIVAIIAISSFIPFVIDPSKFLTKKFLTDQMIVIAITLSVSISMIFIAQASNADNPRSEIAKAKVAFNESVSKITDLTRFFQWVKKVLRQKDKEEIIEREMMRIGVPTNVYYLCDSELEDLVKNPQKYDGVFYKRITKEQYKEIKRLKKHISKLKFVSPNYYTTCKNIEPSKTNSERASTETSKKLSYVLASLLSKIVTTLVFAMVVASLVFDTTGGGEGATKQAWLDFLSRMFAFASSSFLGFCVGAKFNDMDAFYIMNRVEAHNQYLKDSTFVKVDEAKEEFIERVREEQVLIENKNKLTYNKEEEHGA